MVLFVAKGDAYVGERGFLFAILGVLGDPLRCRIFCLLFSLLCDAIEKFVILIR